MFFTETQKINVKWMWILILLPAIFFAYQIFSAISVEQYDFFDHPPVWQIIGLVLSAMLIAYFAYASMYTEMDKKGIIVQHIFSSFTIPWTDVQSVQMITYTPMIGWGLRSTPEYGKVYNISGDKGMLFHLINGDKVLIGTQTPDVAKTFLEVVEPTKLVA